EDGMTRLRSGVEPLPIANCQMPIGCFGKKLIGNRKLAIGNGATHPLPRGGTDLIGTASYRNSAG
ncbi:MAG TPA: hypothetical protein VGJ55_11940, partial [Pyrinomonadaceae bacterium]